MKAGLYKIIIVFFCIYAPNQLFGGNFITVAADGSGDYKTISEAIYSLPMFNYERITIYVKNGIYNEKIRIDQDYITLRGQNREKTIIRYFQPRPDWLANKDTVGPGVININGDDIIIENLTAENTQPDTNIHAFVIYGFGTRTIIQNCNLVSKGGDTVALWDYKTGMYYLDNCSITGAVDFICPRGWCFIKNSDFYEVRKTVAIWHAGGYDKNQKFVIKNSFFDGVEGFDLGRHHYEAQFYLIDCIFSDNMSNTPIYRVVNPDTSANRPFNWGQRYYFYNCTRKAGNFQWFKNNQEIWPDNTSPKQINSAWTFDNQWLPEETTSPFIVSFKIESNILFLIFNEKISISDAPVLKSASGKIFDYASGRGSDTLQFTCDKPFTKKDIKNLTIINNVRVTGTTASTTERTVSFTIKL